MQFDEKTGCPQSFLLYCFKQLITNYLITKPLGLMKNNSRNWWSSVNPRKIAVPAFWFVLGVLFIISLSTAIKEQSVQNIKSIDIEIDEASQFITKEKVEVLLREYYETDDLIVSFNDLNLKELEWVLREHPYIEKADLYVDGSERLFINIHQRFPILRVINNYGDDFYLDNYGKVMPTSNDFTARVPVVTGAVTSPLNREVKNGELSITELFTLADFIQKNSIASALTEQVLVENPEKIKIISKIGDHTIDIGNVKNLHTKYTNLMVFYKHGLRKEGWNTCKDLDISVDNQVVCSTDKS